MLVILAAVFYFYGDNLFKNNNEIYEENKTAMFNVSKIQYYSDVNAVSNQTTYQNPEWNLNVYQYTDIALYIERLDDFSSENYIKSLNISDIKISDSKKGTQKIYYLNPLAYGNGDILNSENEIKGILEYNIMNYENEDNQYPVHTAVSIFLPAERTAHGFPASDNSGIPPPVSSSWPYPSSFHGLPYILHTSVIYHM